jgi:hypothetical protein
MHYMCRHHDCEHCEIFKIYSAIGAIAVGHIKDVITFISSSNYEAIYL